MDSLRSTHTAARPTLSNSGNCFVAAFQPGRISLAELCDAESALLRCKRDGPGVESVHMMAMNGTEHISESLRLNTALPCMRHRERARFTERRGGWAHWLHVLRTVQGGLAVVARNHPRPRLGANAPPGAPRSGGATGGRLVVHALRAAGAPLKP